MSMDREKSLTYVVNHISRQLSQALNAELQSHGVAPGQFPVLLCLWEQDGLSQRELYQRVKIEQATMSNTLKRMERDCLIYRETDPEDRRSTRIHLTGMAKNLEAKLTKGAKAVNKVALEGLKKKDRKQAMEWLDLMVENLDKAAQKAPVKLD
ncbi:MAG: MarR family transcriptional regulator [Magnetovibrio sp.]|nr:MarR family transcriptional regulator [Magnetovibrio sp.]